MISIARAAAVSPALKDRHIHFVYGGRTPHDICGEDMLRALPGFGERIHYTPVVSMTDDPASAGWTGKTGFVHDVAEAMFGEKLAGMEVYFAGPPMMAQAVTKTLIKAKTPPAQMHFDQFY
jgi:toluene monooxygenase electron transfer component